MTHTCVRCEALRHSSLVDLYVPFSVDAHTLSMGSCAWWASTLCKMEPVKVLLKTFLMGTLSLD